MFRKIEYKKEKLPFYYIKEKEDEEAGAISIEAYGKIDGITKYLYATFILLDPTMYDGNDYEDMIEVLKKTKEKNVIINLKYKKGELVGFTLDCESLAKNLNDERFNKIEILYMGINNESAIREEK